MNEEHLFRTMLIVILVVLFPFALYHRLKSQATGEPLDRRQEGIFILGDAPARRPGDAHRHHRLSGRIRR